MSVVDFIILFKLSCLVFNISSEKINFDFQIQMDSCEDSKQNLSSVINRVIELIHNDLDELNKLLQSSDPFTLKQKQNDVKLKRERCATLLKVLQNTLAAENEWELKNEGNTNDTKIQERSKAADKIMSLLKNRQLIEVSELAIYLERTLSIVGDLEDSSTKVPKIDFRKREPKSIRKIRKVYKAPLKRNLI